MEISFAKKRLDNLIVNMINRSKLKIFSLNAELHQTFIRINEPLV